MPFAHPFRLLAAALCLALAACSGEVSGVLSGLGSERSLSLQNNGTDTLTLTENGRFAFNDTLAKNEAYSVTVLTQPSGQTCTVTNGSGTIDSEGASVDDVTVNCVFANNVRGSVTGLGGGAAVTLVNNGSATLAVAANGPFAFPQTAMDGEAYDVQVQAQPAGQTCTVANGRGTFYAASFQDITVSCN